MNQHEQPGTREDLARYRLETARSDIKAAIILLEAGEFRSANNRAYYALYHMISAIHALDGKAFKRHKDTLGNFNKDYIKTEIFPRSFGHRIAEAEEIRHASDYDDFFIATKSEAEEQIETAIELLKLIEIYCETRM